MLPDGDLHCFSQFGSGSLAGAGTHLSEYMLIDPFDMEPEAEHLAKLGIDAFNTTTADPRALVITPFHKAANQIRESLRGGGRHGSCGRGIGECRQYHLTFGEDALTLGELSDPSLIDVKLTLIRQRLFKDIGESAISRFPEYSECFTNPGMIDRMVRHYGRLSNRIAIQNSLTPPNSETGTIIFEGAQGVLLDETHGYLPPHVTWTGTTLANASRLCEAAAFEASDRYRLGVLRAYHTRHGAGPFPSESPELGAAIPDRHNGTGPWQGVFRVGWFDREMAKYALGVCPVDGLAITCLDRIETAGVGWRALVDGKVKTVARSPQGFIDWIERSLNIPVVITSWGPTANDKQLRSELPFIRQEISCSRRTDAITERSK